MRLCPTFVVLDADIVSLALKLAAVLTLGTHFLFRG